MYTIDFETYYDREYQLRKLTTEAYIRDPRFEVICVAVKHNDEETVIHMADPSDWRGSIGAALAQYHLENEYVCAHNAVFDMAILNWHFGIRPKGIIDTLSMSRPVTMLTVGQSLRALAEYFHLGHKGTKVYDMLGRHRADMTDDEISDYGDYCKLDVDLTYQLCGRLMPYTNKQELYIIDMMIRMFSEPMVELDKSALQKHLDEVLAAQQNLLQASGLESRDVLMSNPQFAEMLKGLGVEPPMKTSLRTGQPTYAFAKNDLEFTALLEHDDPRVQALVAARLGLKSTIEETRTRMFLEIADRGALPIMLTYYGGHTGRASGADKINLQNLPRGGALRYAMRAPRGYAMVACDSSQIEARTLAWFAGQTDLVDEFANGVDVYSSFATSVYGYKVTKKEHPVERHVGKTATLGLGFGTGGVKLNHALRTSKPKVELPQEETKRIVDLYRRKYSMIPKLWKAADYLLEALDQGCEATLGVGVNLMAKDDRILLPNGMSIFYNELQTRTNPWDETKVEKVYLNRNKPVSIYGAKVVENVVQALARIVVFDQMANIDRWLRARTAKDGVPRKVVLTVHDEVVVCVPVGEVAETQQYMEKVMSTPPTWAQTLPIACEAGYGTCYGECK